MAGLFKKEVVIKPNSSSTLAQAKTSTKNWLDNNFQNATTNKDANNNYIDYFFADIFDSRTGNIIRLFSSACESYYGMTKNADGFIEFELLNLSKLAKTSDIQTVDLTQINGTLANHEERLVALEDNGDGMVI